LYGPSYFDKIINILQILQAVSKLLSTTVYYLISQTSTEHCGNKNITVLIIFIQLIHNFGTNNSIGLLKPTETSSHG